MISSEGIKKLRVFALPGGICGNGCATTSGFGIVKWESLSSNKLYQVYVNGKFSGATTESSQRQIIAALPDCRETAINIEIYAVDYQDANTDFSNVIKSKSKQARVKIEFQKLIEGYADFFIEDEKQNKENIAIQPGRNGFGWGVFGCNDFGLENSFCPGFGKANFGLSGFGFDSELMRWQSRQLDSGTYKVKMRITDEKGNARVSETETMAIIRQAKPASKIILDKYDKQLNKLVLNIL